MSGVTPMTGRCCSCTAAARPVTRGAARRQALAAQGWRAVSLDLRGHGDSEWALNGDYSFTAFAADTIAVADQLGRPPVARGRVARRRRCDHRRGTAPTASCRVRSSSSTSRTASNPEGIQRIKDFMSSGAEGFATLEDAADAIAAYTPNRPKRVNPAGLMKVLRQKPDGRWYWHWDPQFIDRGRTRRCRPGTSTRCSRSR